MNIAELAREIGYFALPRELRDQIAIIFIDRAIQVLVFTVRCGEYAIEGEKTPPTLMTLKWVAMRSVSKFF